MSVKNVTEINLKKPHPDCIEVTKELLKDAQSGEIQGLAYVVTYHDGAVSSGHGGLLRERLRTVVGGLEFLKAHLIAEDE